MFVCGINAKVWDANSENRPNAETVFQEIMTMLQTESEEEFVYHNNNSNEEDYVNYNTKNIEKLHEKFSDQKYCIHLLDKNYLI